MSSVLTPVILLGFMSKATCRIRRPISLIAVAAAVLFASVSTLFAPSAGALSQTPEMVLDIGTGSNGSDDLVTNLGDLSDIFVDGDIAYFAARSTDGSGDGLWKSDGTAGGTVQIASATQLGGAGIDNFVKVGNNIYFTVNKSYYTNGSLTDSEVFVKKIRRDDSNYCCRSSHGQSRSIWY